MKATFDDSDLELLKSFVRRQLQSQENTHLTFASGNRTHKGHLAAIIKMALELKKLTVDQAEKSSSLEDTE